MAYLKLLVFVFVTSIVSDLSWANPITGSNIDQVHASSDQVEDVVFSTSTRDQEDHVNDQSENEASLEVNQNTINVRASSNEDHDTEDQTINNSSDEAEELSSDGTHELDKRDIDSKDEEQGIDSTEELERESSEETEKDSSGEEVVDRIFKRDLSNESEKNSSCAENHDENQKKHSSEESGIDSSEEVCNGLVKTIVEIKSLLN